MCRDYRARTNERARVELARTRKFENYLCRPDLCVRRATTGYRGLIARGEFYYPGTESGERVDSRGEGEKSIGLLLRNVARTKEILGDRLTLDFRRRGITYRNRVFYSTSK